MAISVIAGRKRGRGTGDYSKETISQSTATAFQAVNLFVGRVHLGMGTATGFARNRYSIAATGADEGSTVSFLTTGTGEAHLHLGAGTATGLWVFTETDDYLLTKLEDGKWRVLTNSGVTQATAT